MCERIATAGAVVEFENTNDKRALTDAAADSR